MQTRPNDMRALKKKYACITIWPPPHKKISPFRSHFLCHFLCIYLYMLKEISFYADFWKRDGVTHTKKETEPSQSFAGNTNEEKNSHHICVCALRWKKSQPKAVFLLGSAQIRKYAKEPSGSIFLRQCLPYFFSSRCVFVGALACKYTNVQKVFPVESILPSIHCHHALPHIPFWLFVSK